MEEDGDLVSNLIEIREERKERLGSRGALSLRAQWCTCLHSLRMQGETSPMVDYGDYNLPFVVIPIPTSLLLLLSSSLDLLLSSLLLQPWSSAGPPQRHPPSIDHWN